KDGKQFVFSSSNDDVPLIKTAVYESIVELHKNLSELKQLAQPDTLKTQIYGNDVKERKESTKNASSITLGNILTPDNIVINLKANNKNEAFKELLNVINAHNPLTNVDKCYQDILERESVVSTYQDNGIAMPHARTDGTTAFMTAIGVTQKGFDYDGDSQHRTNLVILSLCPDDEPGPYLQFISQVALVLSDDAKRKAIVRAKTSEEAIKVFIA
ncbi:MAG: PTS sugar transporter subunit IIA, partial [Victivallales bacterium]|nr:PTS sugar transporter subunit IIA [Victivallales bacterium]